MLVKAINPCFVGSYRRVGDEFEYSGPPNDNLKPLSGKWPSKPSQSAPPPPAPAPPAPAPPVEPPQVGIVEPQPIDR